MWECYSAAIVFMLEYLAWDVVKVKPNFKSTVYQCLHYPLKCNCYVLHSYWKTAETGKCMAFCLAVSRMFITGIKLRIRKSHKILYMYFGTDK
jgi:hypothetical protein